MSKPQLFKKILFSTFASDCEESSITLEKVYIFSAFWASLYSVLKSFDVAVADKVEEISIVKDVIGGSKVDSYCCRCLCVYAQKWFNIPSLMSVIDADVLDASPLFPDVENEPKVADDALIDVSNKTDVLFCWMYRQY